MREGNKNMIKNEFNRAVSDFWNAAGKAPVDRLALIDAADRVFLARDGIGALKNGLSVPEWDDLIRDVADVSEYLGRQGIVMGRLQTTVTGRKTYRMLNKPTRFDA